MFAPEVDTGACFVQVLPVIPSDRPTPAPESEPVCLLHTHLDLGTFFGMFGFSKFSKPCSGILSKWSYSTYKTTMTVHIWVICSFSGTTDYLESGLGYALPQGGLGQSS